ncbi:carbohydrate ABC transporter membrane protein 1, CUT1 family (TC 3.A.1.1.-) [Gracilibacillus orientalis]|uniref:Carbohydrate ABC transporter membrane protein 1, CUT1 family (TC 3.A.1.1.-) n=1 Tax=Gracilibacillus orientalis TaxID=334253 RepID=A0A1I4GVZ0_9BACI|nr:sugar ABC transporter permease [Gracilibacillus orientalis]SFL33710.1 carbohydrate ABC transporter membrane protein 1, CUT1 family (TC 3.A.1.1.-) [Gracilibacillus orientalis]
MRKKFGDKIEGYIFVLPAVIFMLLLIGYPLIYNIVLSFQNVDLSNLGGGDKSFVGFDNYRNVSGEEAFGISIKNTLIYTFASVIFQVIIGFFLATFFSMKFRLAGFLRGIMMISWLIPMTVTALLFKFIMGSSDGIFNQMLLSFNIINEPIGWLSSPDVALWSVIIANIWVGIPFNMLLLSTGLSGLPQDVYESASLDGASWWQKLVHITIPLLRPVIMVVLMLGFIYTFKVFDIVYVMTGGGPINSTEVLSTLAFRYSFTDFDFSLGAAVANVLFLILFAISLVYLRMIKKDEAI